MKQMGRRTVSSAAVFLFVLVVGACSASRETGPSPVLIAVSIPEPVRYRIETCATCNDPLMAVAAFAVTISDPLRQGGTVAAVETRVYNRSRAIELAQNTRPNATVGYDDATVPRDGTLQLEAGVVFPVPPTRDEVIVTVTVRMSSGREGIDTARLEM